MLGFSVNLFIVKTITFLQLKSKNVVKNGLLWNKQYSIRDWQIWFIDDKYINLGIVHLKHIQFIRTITEIWAVSFTAFLPIKFIGYVKIVWSKQMDFICNSNTWILNLGLNILALKPSSFPDDIIKVWVKSILNVCMSHHRKMCY